MFVELGLFAIGAYTYSYMNKSDERKIKNKFKEIMIKTGIKNKDDETFEIYKIIPTSYGFMCYISNVKGLSLEHLQSKMNIIEGNLNAIVEIQKDRFKDYIQMWIVNKDISDFKFKPVRCENYELCIGKDFKGQNYLVDLTKNPHILIGGATGTGKTFLLACMLTNIIYNSSNDVELYLLQICKSEISAFENCNCIKYLGYNPKECITGLDKIIEELDRRSEIFKKHGIRNVSQWNKHFKDRQMKRVICVIEEMSFFMNQGNEESWEDILKIAKAGRSVGIHLISCIQRSTATNLPPDLKSQMTRITFRQKSSIDSNNIINTSDATKLKERECIIDGNSDYQMVKTPWVDEDYILLHKYVPEIKIPNQEEKQEIIKVKNIKNKIYSIEQPKVVDINEKDITDLYENKPSDKSYNKNKEHKGVISLEEFNNANKKR